MRKKTYLHSDDFGYRPAIDRKLLHLINSSSLSGVSVLATTITKKSIDALAALQRKKENLSVSLHVNLIEGKSIASPYNIPSLVDSKGNFYSLVVFFARILLGLVKKEEVRTEIRAQLAYLRKHSIAVTMIDSHQHVHALSPVAEVVADIAHSEGVAHIRPFGAFANHTLKARATYNLLRLMARATHLVYYGSLKLPATWHAPSAGNWTIMSWEGSSYEISKNQKMNTYHVVHPHLGFDSNTSYKPLLKTARK